MKKNEDIQNKTNNKNEIILSSDVSSRDIIKHTHCKINP